MDAGLELVPEDAYYVEKAGSPRALICAPGDFAHKVVVIAEADSIPEEGPAASAIRSLAADNVTEYEVVERNPQTGQFETRRIVKPGPTGLITTFTRPLPEQMNTRVLTVSVADSPGQTREVLRAHAASVNGDTSSLDNSPFIAMQRWLDIAGVHSVTIPFAEALASMVPTLHVRMRRDFRQMLTVIQTVALLYQQQRPRDKSGRIVACLDDYRQARELLLDVFTAAASGGVTSQVRETVTALRSLYSETKSPATIKALGERLNLGKDTAWHRARRAIDLDYIVNEETRRGQPAKLVPADALPEERPALPTVEELQAFMCGAKDDNDSTVQPGIDFEAQDQSEDAVETPVEEDFQPPFQPELTSDSDSTTGVAASPVERLKGEPAATHTGDDEADRVYGLALAREMGFPALQIQQGVTVFGGEESWRKFTAVARNDRLRQAIDRLEQLDLDANGAN